MADLEIRKINESDVLALQYIAKQTFFETFAGQNTADDMQKYLDENFTVEKLKKEVNDANSEFYFAQLGNNVIGYLKINFAQAQTEIKDQRSVEIERIYVSKEFHGKKVAQFLYNKAIDVA